jgi:glycosyltransferase involved in cell wall biosynthesis
MLRNKLYYRIKPLVPWSMRVALRRLFALRKRAMLRDTWPVMPGSEKPPANWPGWPDGKKFALVLTHDVESRAGVAKCRQLMELERSLGFRSSFSFIPQGDYNISRLLRNELTRNGFEIGVHDLHHDGRLYHNRQDFVEKAERINKYLKDWGAVGFRSAFMLHNLDWLHDLDLQYDASTFDTDPFEPQPDGVGTIFPFWVPRPSGSNGNRNGNGNSHLVPRKSDVGGSTFDARRSSFDSSGYVELPYTLPQDSTLFLLFGERTPDIWFQKLDWIAKHGGMALLDVHPDYMCFDGDPVSSRTFPAEFYADLLEYAQKRYGDSFWHPLPRELAEFTARLRPPVPTKPRRICMVAYSAYLADARVTRYAEALAGRGDHVDVLALQRSADSPKREVVRNVNLVRIQRRFGKEEKSKVSFLLPLVKFLSASSVWIAREHSRDRYDLFHIHNVPDFLVFAAAYPKLTGAKVILDIHDIVPEFYGSKFGSGANSIPVTLLKWMERFSASLADHVIIANHLWLEKYRSRTGANGKCSVFINNVDSHVFRPRPRIRDDGKVIIMFPGGLQWHQGLDIAIRAFQKVSAELPNAEFHIYGDGNMKPKLMNLAQELGLNGKVQFFNPLPVRQIARIMANADLGVVPKRADSFGNEAYSTKIMEFMSLEVPVVVSNTKIDRYYFDDSMVRFFESGNDDAMAKAMLEVLRDQGLRSKMIARASAYAAKNSWESRKADYLDLVDALLSDHGEMHKSSDPGSCHNQVLGLEVHPESLNHPLTQSPQQLTQPAEKETVELTDAFD